MKVCQLLEGSSMHHMLLLALVKSPKKQHPYQAGVACRSVQAEGNAAKSVLFAKCPEIPPARPLNACPSAFTCPITCPEEVCQYVCLALAGEGALPKSSFPSWRAGSEIVCVWLLFLHHPEGPQAMGSSPWLYVVDLDSLMRPHLLNPPEVVIKILGFLSSKLSSTTCIHTSRILSVKSKK